MQEFFAIIFCGIGLATVLTLSIVLAVGMPRVKD